MKINLGMDLLIVCMPQMHLTVCGLEPDDMNQMLIGITNQGIWDCTFPKSSVKWRPFKASCEQGVSKEETGAL